MHRGLKKKFSKSLEDSENVSTFAVPNGKRGRERERIARFH